MKYRNEKTTITATSKVVGTVIAVAAVLTVIAFLGNGVSIIGQVEAAYEIDKPATTEMMYPLSTDLIPDDAVRMVTGPVDTPTVSDLGNAIMANASFEEEEEPKKTGDKKKTGSLFKEKIENTTYWGGVFHDMYSNHAKLDFVLQNGAMFCPKYERYAKPNSRTWETGLKSRPTCDYMDSSFGMQGIPYGKYFYYPVFEKKGYATSSRSRGHADHVYLVKWDSEAEDSEMFTSIEIPGLMFTPGQNEDSSDPGLYKFSMNSDDGNIYIVNFNKSDEHSFDLFTFDIASEKVTMEHVDCPDYCLHLWGGVLAEDNKLIMVYRPDKEGDFVFDLTDSWTRYGNWYGHFKFLSYDIDSGQFEPCDELGQITFNVGNRREDSPPTYEYHEDNSLDVGFMKNDNGVYVKNDDGIVYRPRGEKNVSILLPAATQIETFNIVGDYMVYSLYGDQLDNLVHLVDCATGDDVAIDMTKPLEKVDQIVFSSRLTMYTDYDDVAEELVQNMAFDMMEINTQDSRDFGNIHTILIKMDNGNGDFGYTYYDFASDTIIEE